MKIRSTSSPQEAVGCDDLEEIHLRPRAAIVDREVDDNTTFNEGQLTPVMGEKQTTGQHSSNVQTSQDLNKINDSKTLRSSRPNELLVINLNAHTSGNERKNDEKW